MTSLETRTGSLTGEADDDGVDEVEVPRLIVAIECRRPRVPALRIVLRELDELVMGRGPERTVARTGGKVSVTLVDHELSRQHARLRWQVGGWEISDLGSKNGTIVNGQRVTRATLADGDVIEIGAILLMFVEGAPMASSHEASDRDLATETDTPLAFRTTSLELERRCEDLGRIAASNVPVLVHGETGTGKELIARAVHDLSGRRGPFVAINCGALAKSLLESELFGYRRGAFSGAREDREGLVRKADGGTLFLDEIAELPEESQVALLRVLQEGEVRPVGASDVIPVDVRIVAATHQDLSRRIADGRFRQDLYSRLAGFTVTLPPLRERREDVGSLIAAILERLGDDTSKVTLQRQAARTLLSHGYPQNVRELEQALRAAVVLSGNGEIRVEHLPEAMRAPAPTAQVLRPEDRVLRERLIEVLRAVKGNVAAAGREMNKAPIQIRRWCRRLGIDLAGFRD